jgi:hypothetical protein
MVVPGQQLAQLHRGPFEGATGPVVRPSPRAMPDGTPRSRWGGAQQTDQWSGVPETGKEPRLRGKGCTGGAEGESARRAGQPWPCKARQRAPGPVVHSARGACRRPSLTACVQRMGGVYVHRGSTPPCFAPAETGTVCPDGGAPRRRPDACWGRQAQRLPDDGGILDHGHDCDGAPTAAPNPPRRPRAVTENRRPAAPSRRFCFSLCIRAGPW